MSRKGPVDYRDLVGEAQIDTSNPFGKQAAAAEQARYAAFGSLLEDVGNRASAYGVYLNKKKAHEKGIADGVAAAIADGILQAKWAVNFSPVGVAPRPQVSGGTTTTFEDTASVSAPEEGTTTTFEDTDNG